MSFKKTKLIKNSTNQVIFNKINFIKKSYNSYNKAKKRNLFFGLFLGILSIISISFLGIYTINKFNSFSFDINFFKNFNIFGMIGEDIKKEKINILLTGIGGEENDAPNLTDTIMLASLNQKNKTVSILSIPRDLYVSLPNKNTGKKINELYVLGLNNLPTNMSMKYLKDKIEEITGEKIDYYLNINFLGFVKFIDLIGGIEIDVPEDLKDTSYPDGNWGYTTFFIKKGLQIIDGKTALKYARSRHTTSDFDRSYRQQLIIKAIKDKLLNLDYIGNISKIKELYSAIMSNINTDLGIKEIIDLAKFAKNLKNEDIFSFNLNDTCYQGVVFCQAGGFLYAPERSFFGGSSVLLTEDSTPTNISKYTSIKKFANLIFNYPEIFKENYIINFVNTTKSNGLANKFALYFKKYGFNVPDLNNTFNSKDKFTKTIIYYLWDEENKTGVNPNSKTLEAISQFIFTEKIPTKNSKYSTNPGVQIEIVLGDDYKLFDY